MCWEILERAGKTHKNKSWDILKRKIKHVGRPQEIRKNNKTNVGNSSRGKNKLGDPQEVREQKKVLGNLQHGGEPKNSLGNLQEIRKTKKRKNTKNKKVGNPQEVRGKTNVGASSRGQGKIHKTKNTLKMNNIT